MVQTNNQPSYFCHVNRCGTISSQPDIIHIDCGKTRVRLSMLLTKRPSPISYPYSPSPSHIARMHHTHNDGFLYMGVLWVSYGFLSVSYGFCMGFLGTTPGFIHTSIRQAAPLKFESLNSTLSWRPKFPMLAKTYT